MEDIKKIPQRSELAVEDTWATEDLYASDEAWEADLTLLNDAKDAIAAFAGKLAEGEQTLLAYLELMESTNAKGELLISPDTMKISAYVGNGKYLVDGKCVDADGRILIPGLTFLPFN